MIDLDYFGNFSGNKIVSPLIDKLLTDGALTQEAKNQLANLIYIKFKASWEHLYSILKAEYNPIENYSMTENATDSKSINSTAETTHGHTVTNTNGSNEESNTGIFGFNSDTAKNADAIHTTTSSDGTERHSGTDTSSGESDEESTHTLTRSGNIGVTTSQQMIQSEIDLWQWNFFTQIYKDIDSILTIQIY